MYLIKATIVASVLNVVTANPLQILAPSLLRRQHHPITTTKLPAWHFTNSTTADATPDGSKGIYLEPDLIPGTKGKDGAEIKKIRLGPYNINPGKMLERMVPPFEPPCKDCFVTAMQLNLEYENGKIANVDTGAWCHHIDMTVPGDDITCPTTVQGVVTGNVPAMFGKRIFSNGNERVPIRLNSKEKYGIRINSMTTFGGSMEFMNENVKPISVYLTMIFEFVDAKTPGYKPAEMVWLDVTDCARSSDFKAAYGVYKKSSRDFVMPKNGKLLVAVGHQHDGGSKVEMYKNGKLTCTSKILYGNRRGGWIEPTDGTILPHMIMPPNSHISDSSHCKDWDAFKKGDKLSVVAYYDGNMHMHMNAAGGRGLDDQMGIMYTYAAFED